MITRCKGCGERFTPKSLYGNLCNSCEKIVQEAIARIPKKETRRLIETTEISVEMLLSLEEAATEQSRSRGGMFGQPIRPLIDNTKETHEGTVHFAGKTYVYSFPTAEGPSKGQAFQEFAVDSEGRILGPW